MQVRRLKAAVAVAAAVALTTSLVGCAESERSEGGGAKDTFVFGAAGEPDNFDPILNDDGETFRVLRQIFDTLIDHKPGSAELQPSLAESWEHNDDGTEWTFQLKQGVKFHDGTDFNAEAVCFNFDRWYNMPSAAAQAQMYYYADTFGGFAKNQGEYGDPLYKSCEATDEHTAVVKLNAFKGAFPAAFTLTSLSMSSPTALKKYDADNVTQQGQAFNYPEYATSHPVGTGPFKFVKFDKANGTVQLERFDDYHGEKAKVKNLIFKIIPDPNARKQELLAGTINGYDFPAPADYQTLKDEGMQLMPRDPFNILYLGINQKGSSPKLADFRVRQAIAYAINREELVRTKLPDGAEVAHQFIPDTVLGYADDVTKYKHDPEKAKALLAEAGAENLTLTFLYPTEVQRPYMPNPKEIFQVVSGDLEAVGIKIKPVALPWNGGYLDRVQTTLDHDLHLLGWTGDYNDPFNFIGTFFGRAKNDFGDAAMKDMFKAINDANSIVDEAEKEAAWQEVNRMIASSWLPAVPISHSPPAIVMGPNVEGMVPSPLTQEEYAPVYVKE